MTINKLLFLILLFISCKTATIPKPEIPIIENPGKITIQKIHCLNMAEKLIGIGTKNDEILLLVFEESPQNEIKFMAATDSLIFEKEDSIGQALNLTIPLNMDQVANKLIFLLLELDTERTKAELIQLSKKHLSENLSFKMLKEKLREDDILGLKNLSVKKVSKTGRLIFSGMHLFDKYHYELSYKFN